MPSPAKHFELADWVDYVRKAGAAGRLAAMERHLTEDRCESCARLAQMLKSAYGAARALGDVDVPDAAVERARRTFAGQSVRPWTDLAVRIGDWVKDLTFPVSGPGLALTGIRSAGVQRQRIYRSGSLEVRIEDENAADGQRMVAGVLVDASDSGASLGGVRTLLVSGQQTLAEAETNEFGEFDFSVAAGRKLRLVVVLSEPGERLEIALDS